MIKLLCDKYLKITTSIMLIVPFFMSITLEYGFGFRLCNLCVVERYSYLIMFFVFCTGLNKKLAKISIKAVLTLIIIAFFITIYHILIENGVLPESSFCGMKSVASMTDEEIINQVFTSEVKMCSEKSYLYIFRLTYLNLIYLIISAGFILINFKKYDKNR